MYQKNFCCKKTVAILFLDKLCVYKVEANFKHDFYKTTKVNSRFEKATFLKANLCFQKVSKQDDQSSP